MAGEFKKILIIDDEADICVFSKKILERTGKFQATVTQNSADGINIARSDKPDIILLDINMPRLEGDEVAHVLSASPLTSSIPIVFITSLLHKAEPDQDKTSNRYFFLPKPISPNEMIDRIEEILGMKTF
ncbi:MAG: response regulator [Candidatus Omnitrophota bacterium]